MFSLFSKMLTDVSNNYIDWTRTADFLRFSGRYDAEKLVVRGAMIMTTALSGYLGAYYNDEESTHCSTTVAAITAATLGLVFSHAYVIAPLVYKRYKMSNECNELIEKIKQEKAGSMGLLLAITDKIYRMSLATDTRANASQTWGHRKALLEKFKIALENSDADILRVIQGVASDKEKIDEVISLLEAYSHVKKFKI